MADDKAAPGELNDEERAAVARAQVENKQIAAKIGKDVDGPISAMDLLRDGENIVTVMAPKDFIYRPDHHRVVEIKAGPQSMPAHMVDHWWVRANGVKPFKGQLSSPEPILGSATLPDPVDINGEMTPVGDVLLAAFKASGKTVEEWNAQPEPKRDELISAEIEARRANGKKSGKK